jgi:hypothetical protein
MHVPACGKEPADENGIIVIVFYQEDPYMVI